MQLPGALWEDQSVSNAGHAGPYGGPEEQGVNPEGLLYPVLLAQVLPAQTACSETSCYPDPSSGAVLVGQEESPEMAESSQSHSDILEEVEGADGCPG